jgi:hypothetical protein
MEEVGTTADRDPFDKGQIKFPTSENKQHFVSTGSCVCRRVAISLWKE